jgi:hypothetical protein
VPGYLPYPIYRIWTDSHTSESLSDLMKWPYIRIVEANEWLDIVQKSEEDEAE